MRANAFGNALGNAAIAGIEHVNEVEAEKQAIAKLPATITPYPAMQVDDIPQTIAPVSTVPDSYIAQDEMASLPHGTVNVGDLQVLSEGDGTANNLTGNDYENLLAWSRQYGMAPPPADGLNLDAYRQGMDTNIAQQWAGWRETYGVYEPAVQPMSLMDWENQDDLKIFTSPLMFAEVGLKEIGNGIASLGPMLEKGGQYQYASDMQKAAGLQSLFGESQESQESQALADSMRASANQPIQPLFSFSNNEQPYVTPAAVTLAGVGALNVGGDLVEGVGILTTPDTLLANEIGATLEFPEGGIPPDVGAQRVADIRFTLGIAPSRNIALGESVINGEGQTFVAVSGKLSPDGTVPVPTDPIFNVVNSGAMPRGYDTEVKILENYAQGLPLDATGTINLYTQRAPCFSCQGVIQQFQNRYPGISLVITSGGD